MPVHADRTGRGPVVLFTHGFGSSSHVFDGARRALSDEHTIVTWDLPGHGRSVVPEAPEEFTPERSLDHITTLLDDAGADQAVLGGHSLGGYLSLRYALDHPERVTGLILVGTGPGYRNDEGRAGWNDMCDGFACALDERGLDGLGGAEQGREVHEGGAAGLALAARGILPQRDSRVIDELARITVPALVVVGERDRQFLASSRYLAAKLPGAGGHPVIIADCGHTPPVSQPAAFVGAVRDFLVRHRR